MPRFCFLCEFGSGHKQHGSNGRRGRQSLRLESEWWRSSAGVQRWGGKKQQLKMLEPTLAFEIYRLAPPDDVIPLKNLCSHPDLNLWNKSRFCWHPIVRSAEVQLLSSLIVSKPVWWLIYYLSVFDSIGHKDSVTCAMFSNDSSLVATADMSGLIKVWKVESKEELWSFEVGDLEVRKCMSACASVSTCAECAFIEAAGIY